MAHKKTHQMTSSKAAKRLAVQARITTKDAAHLLSILERLSKRKSRATLVIPGVGKLVFEKERTRVRPTPRSRSGIQRKNLGTAEGSEIGSGAETPGAEASGEPETHGPGGGRPW